MRLPRQPAAVVFDMDGLLFDNERLYEQASIAAAAELGYELDSAFHRTTVGSPWPVIHGLLLKAMARPSQPRSCEKRPGGSSASWSRRSRC